MTWLLIILTTLSLLALASCALLGGPGRYGLISLASGLLLLWAWLSVEWWAGLAWFALFGGLRLGLSWDYSRRVEETNKGRTGRARYLSFVSNEIGRRALVLWLPPLKGLLYWLVRRARMPMPGANGMLAGDALLPVLDRIYGQSRGFRLDTRHLSGVAGKALEIRCD